MKAITIKQPWASLIIEGKKRMETRSHNRFKGLIGERIAIHSAKSINSSDLCTIPVDLDDEKRFPRGYVLGTAVVVGYGALKGGCVDEHLALCRNNAGKYGLVFHLLEKFDKPIPAIGKQGIWKWEA